MPAARTSATSSEEHYTENWHPLDSSQKTKRKHWESKTANEMLRGEGSNLGRQNLICNFRAPDREHFQIWQNFKEAAKNRGLDVCYLILSLCQAWLKSDETAKEIAQITTANQIINLQQQNTFVYSVQKPRREPNELICSSGTQFRTVRSRALQAYIIERARELPESFSFRDFPELGHSLFRKCIMELKKRGKVIPLDPRTNQRFYILTERKPDYPTMNENNRVKPRFSLEPQQGVEAGKTDNRGAA